MAVLIKFDNNHIPLSPTLVLANRNGNKLGVIPALHINVADHLNAAMELQFEVQKSYNGVDCPIWDDITDFKLAWCPEWDKWFEIHIEAKDGESVAKSISAISLGEAELSQINLYSIEINTETDIDRDDYVPTVLYNESNAAASLLDRIMEKAPHYSIGHVDDSIANIQRTFTFDGTTILDAFNAIAEEIDCLFVIDSGSALDGSISRTVNVYDLESVCNDCGYRGVFTGDCPECGGSDITDGYGENTNIYVSSENLTDEVTYTSNVDSVKNCFRLVGGDDLMTAAIASCNPNGSSYMWYFSDAMREDMSDALQTRLEEYDEEFASYATDHGFAIPSALRSSYNTLVNKYKTYRPDLNTVSSPIAGYSSLMNVYYDTIDFEMLLRNELMPSVELSTKTAATEAAKLTSARLSPAAVTNLDICSMATASSSVLSVAKQVVDGNFQVKVNGLTFNKPTWTGNFTVTNYSDEEDTATTGTVTVTITDDQETYLSQRINSILSDAEDDLADVVNLFHANLATFQNELKKYCLASLNSMRDICQSCVDILIQDGVANDTMWAGTETDLYTQIYLPYYNKLNAIISEVALRESELAIITGVLDENGGVVTDGMQTVIQKHNADAQEHLNFENFLGTELMTELAAYRREDTFENGNFITDGLSNAEIFERALEFIVLAKKEIYKSATLQHSITSTLKNLLVMKEFSSLTTQFAVGNWLTVGVGGKPYRLRLMSYEIDFDDLDNINVEFTDVVETLAGANDLESILKSAASIATSFSSVKRQADRGGKANMTLDEMKEKGLALTSMKIINSAENQNVTWDEHGLLCRELVPYNDEYDERQLKIINRGLYLTDDGWRTSRAGIGDFLYYDPSDGQIKEGYGVVSDMLIGNLVLSEEVGIYNTNNTITLDKNGLTITTTNTGTDDTAFLLRKMVNGTPQNVIWFDTSGNANFRGNFSLVSGGTDVDVGEAIGDAVTNVSVEYNRNQSTTVPPAQSDANWSTVAPAWQYGYYVWQRTVKTTPDGTTYSTPACISKAVDYAVAANGSTAQSETMRRLTNNGASTGIWLNNGELYMNATYLRSGTIDGGLVNAKLLNILNDDGDIIAQFNDTITLGSPGSTYYASLDQDSFELYDDEGTKYLSAGSSVVPDEITVLDEELVSADGSVGTTFTVSEPVYRIYAVYVGGVETSAYTFDGRSTITLSNEPADGESIEVLYGTYSNMYHYDFGTRKASTAVGRYSIVEGKNINASGDYAHGEGFETEASGNASHAEGHGSKATGKYSLATNYMTTASGAASHAEGGTTVASQRYAHAEGYYTEASGAVSHAEGARTIANHLAQHVFGFSNIADTSTNANDRKGTYVEIVGNGDNYTRSNARTLDWNGNEWIAGALSVGDTATTLTNLGVYSKSEIDTMIGSGGGSSLPTPVSVQNGGTGLSSLTSGSALIGNGTGNVTLRSITNNTSSTYITASTNLITANTLAYWNGAYNSSGSSRITKVGTITSGTWNGTAISSSYIGSHNHGAGDITSGTLAIGRGGTGATSIANIQAGKDGDGNTISSTYMKSSRFHTTTVTGTTSNAGNVGSTLSSSQYFVLSARAGNNYVVTTIVGTSGNWAFHIADNSSAANAISNTSVSVTVLYCDA